MSGRRSRRGAVLIAVAAIVVVAVLFVPVMRIVLARYGGDEEPTFVRIVNDTDDELTIYLVDVAGERSKLLVVVAHTTGKYFDSCAAARLVAVGPHNADVASRPASEQCNLADWIIESPDRP